MATIFLEINPPKTINQKVNKSTILKLKDQKMRRKD